MELAKALLVIFLTNLNSVDVIGHGATTCSNALGMEDGTIPNSDITASSEANCNHAPRLGRLNQMGRPGWAGAWCTKYNDLEQWFQVDFTEAARITVVATQGRQDYNQWVKTFTIGSSQDGGYFERYTRNGQERVFSGNTDRNRVVRHVLNPPIIARYVRIYPKTWQSHICMRAEFYGCRSVCRKGSFDFEKGARSLVNWVPSGTAFNNQPTYGDNPTARKRGQPSNHQGHYWIGGFEKRPSPESTPGAIAGDGPQGTLKSPTFLITGPNVLFLIGGGCHINAVRVELVVNNKVVRRATGKCTETMERRSWELREFIGRRAFIRLVDRSSGGWGHINFDDFAGDMEFCEGFVAPPQPVCGKALGMQDGHITDNMIKSSSDHSHVCRSSNARLYFRPQSGRVGSWCAKRNDIHQYIQVDFGKWTQVTRVAVQGRYDANQWVRRYSIDYSYDCALFQPYKQNGQTTVFLGSTDRNRIVSSKLDPPVVARCIRIHPQQWNGHISMRSEFYGCYSGFDIPDIGCAHGLGMEDRTIPDSAVTASSEANSNHGPSNARLNFINGGGKTGSWSSRVNDLGQWLQIDLGKITKVTRVSTQGRREYDQWVTSYFLSYSYDGGVFTPYANRKRFKGNSDRNTIVVHKLEPAIIARFVRFNILSWRSHISMRAELYGCHSGFTPPPIPQCSEALGMQGGRIKDAQISGTDLNSGHRAQNARLHFHAGGGRTGSWSAKRNDIHQYLQVRFNKAVKVTKIGTQGRQDYNQWVTRFALSYSQDGVFWEWYKVNRRTKVFNGNNDRYTVVINEIRPAVIAKYVRIHPQTWHGHISMRFELYGCRTGFKPPSPPACREALGMESRRIPDSKITAYTEYNHVTLKAKAARFNNKGGAWCASSNNNPHNWIQVDLAKPLKVTAVATKGRYNAAQWIKSYTLEYSQDGLVFDKYENGKVFQGNTDHRSISGHLLEPAILARYIRIRIKTWHSFPCMRFEIYGCRRGKFASTTRQFQYYIELNPKTFGRGFVPPPIPSCVTPLGMQNYHIANHNIQASSVWHHSHSASNARLHFKSGSGRTGGWSAKYNNNQQWLQVDLERLMAFSRVAIQGRYDYNQWVTSFTFSYSLDGKNWVTYKENGRDKVFTGNWDRHTVVIHAIRPAVVGRYARINVKSWYGHVSMRSEFYGCEGKVPLIKQPVVSAITQAVNGKTKFFAKCQFETMPNKFVKGAKAVYKVDWLVNDKVVRTETLSGVRKFALLEGNTHGFKAGTTVSCKVRGKFDLKNEVSYWSSWVESNDFYAGLVVNPTKVVVSENQASETVTLTSTVPVCCGSFQECGLTVEINQVDDVVTNKCELQFQNSHLIQDFQVKALKDFLDDGNRHVQLTFKPITAQGQTCDFWNGYQPQPVTVITIDESHQSCQGTGDPHYKSFDGRHYHLLKYPGDYRMAQSTVRPFEVHARTWKCWKVTCNCAVAVRENNDLIFVDMCNGRWGHTTPKVIRRTPSGVQSDDRVVIRKITAGRTTTYKMFFRSGAEVEAKAYYWGLNVKITVPSDDRGNTVGLCGNNNGDKNDDYNGANPKAHWIPPGKSFFYQIPPKVQTEKPFACTCKKASWGGNYLACDVKRRGVNIHEGQPANVIPPGKGDVSYKFNPGTVEFGAVRWPTASGITEQKARQACKATLENSPVGKACHKLMARDQDNLVEDCVLDIAVSDRLSIKDSALEAMLDECRENILRKPKSKKRGLEVDHILSMMCPQSCSGHGTCRNRECECSKGFGAADCGIDLNKPPVLDAIKSPCDTRDHECKVAEVIGSGFLDSDKLTCHISKFTYQIDKWIPAGSEVSKGESDSFREVDCEVPVKYFDNRKFSGPVKLDISISNDGKLKSNRKSLIIFDSDCFEVRENGVVSQKDNICLIKGACFTNGETNSANPRQVCQPSKNKHAWSQQTVQADVSDYQEAVEDDPDA